MYGRRKFFSGHSQLPSYVWTLYDHEGFRHPECLNNPTECGICERCICENGEGAGYCVEHSGEATSHYRVVSVNYDLIDNNHPVCEDPDGSNDLCAGSASASVQFFNYRSASAGGNFGRYVGTCGLHAWIDDCDHVLCGQHCSDFNAEGILREKLSRDYYENCDLGPTKPDIPLGLTEQMTGKLFSAGSPD